MDKNPYLHGSPDEFIEENLDLAHHVAWKYIPVIKKDARVKLDEDDIISIAYLGLVKAYIGFNPTKFIGKDGNRVKFSTYAVPRIKGEIMQNLRDYGYTVRQKRGTGAYSVDSLDREIVSERNKASGGRLTVGDTIPDEKCNDEQSFVSDFLSKVSPRLQLVYKLRTLDVSQEQVGEVLGLTQVSASKMELYLLESARQYGMGMDLSSRTRYRTEGYKKKVG